MTTTNNKHKRTFNELLKLFEEDKLTENYLYNNLTYEERWWFGEKIRKHPNKYFAGKQLSENQKHLVKEFFYMERCKRDDCEFYHSEVEVDFCNKCVNYEQSKYLKYKKTKSNDLLCSICLVNVDKNTKHAVLKCNHCFHKECIRKWLTKNMNCPYCRENFNQNTNQISNRAQYINSNDINLNDMNLDDIITRLYDNNLHYRFNLDDLSVNNLISLAFRTSRLNQNEQSINNLISSSLTLRTSR